MNRRSFLRSLGAAPAAWMLAKYGIPNSAEVEAPLFSGSAGNIEGFSFAELLEADMRRVWTSTWIAEYGALLDRHNVPEDERVIVLPANALQLFL